MYNQLGINYLHSKYVNGWNKIENSSSDENNNNNIIINAIGKIPRYILPGYNFPFSPYGTGAIQDF